MPFTVSGTMEWRYIGLDPFEGTEIFSDNGLPALLKRGYIDFDPFEDTGS